MARIERLRALYERQAGDRILAVMQLPPGRALREFAEAHEAGYCRYPDPEERIAFWDALFAERRDIEDDSIPAAYLSEMDQGLYGGLLGGQVRLLCDHGTGWISSMVPPLLCEWADFDRLTISFDNLWGRRYRNQLKIFRQGAVGKFTVSHFILIDSLNFVYELFGAGRTYEELIDNPEQVHRAIDFAYELNSQVQDYFFGQIPLFAGGTCSTFAHWLPGRVVSESLDPFHMTSVDYFEEWGREPAERIMARYDGGIIHLHGNGRHLLEAASTLKGLKAIFLGDDIGYPPSFEVLPELRRRAGDVPLSVNMSHADFTAALDAHSLPGGVLYQISGMTDVETANRMMKKVRVYRV
jgi:hypothetical protein